MHSNRTTNGVLFTEEITSINGATFTLFPEERHTKEDVQKAKAEIRHQRDVVRMLVASEYDRDHFYKGQIFEVEETFPLKWYEIEQDEKLLRRERKKGTTPEEFVKRFVLPFTKQVKEKYYKQFGHQIFTY